MPTPNTQANTALAVAPQALDEALEEALAGWLAATSDAASPRHADLLRGKRRAVLDFLAGAGKPLETVNAADALAWARALGERGLAPATIAARLSHLSSFFAWLLRHPALAARRRENPFRQARPKTPKPYQSEATRALGDGELRRLCAVLETRAARGEAGALRDHAVFLFLMHSGMRRAEVLRLRGRDLERDERGLIVSARVKGGQRVRRYVTHPSVWEALVAYLTASGRGAVLRHLDAAAGEAPVAARPVPGPLHPALDESAPLWVRHDPGREAAGAEQPLAEWSFARRMKACAAEAGIPHFHLHQTRHTFARIVAETTGSLSQTQEALGHRHLATTRAYVARLRVLPDLHGDAIARRMRPAD